MILAIILTSQFSFAAPELKASATSVSNKTLSQIAVEETIPQIREDKKKASEVTIRAESVALLLQDPGLVNPQPWLRWSTNLGISSYQNPFLLSTKYQGFINLSQLPEVALPSISFSAQHSWYGMVARYSATQQSSSDTKYTSSFFDLGLEAHYQIPTHQKWDIGAQLGTSNIHLTAANKYSDMKNSAAQASMSFVSLQGRYAMTDSFWPNLELTQYQNLNTQEVQIKQGQFTRWQLGATYLW